MPTEEQTNPTRIQTVVKTARATLKGPSGQTAPRKYRIIIDVLILAAIITSVYLSYTNPAAAPSVTPPQTTSTMNPPPKPKTELSTCKDLECVEQKLAANPTISGRACEGMDNKMVSNCKIVYRWKVQKIIPPKELCDRFFDEELKRVCKNVTSNQNG